MGAMQTRTVTLAFPDKFSHIGLFSGGTISMADVNSIPDFKNKFKLVFISYGSREIGGNRGGGRGIAGLGGGAGRGFGGARDANAVGRGGMGMGAGRGRGAVAAGEPNQARGAMAGRGRGMGGGMGGNPQDSVEALKKAGINAVFYVSPLTAHEFQSWRRSLREYSMLLFKN